MGKLTGKTAVVTGGSSGMALASAVRFAEEGAEVFITGRRPDALEAAASSHPRLHPVLADSTDLDDLDRLFETVRAAAGSIDVLFASAGYAGGSPLADVTPEDFDATFSLNTRGTLFTVQKALPLLNHGASIIMTGSVVAARGYPGLGVYAASKAALRSFAGTWLHELKDRRIRVNVLSPGSIATPAQTADAEARRDLEAQIPAGRMGTSEEIAEVALFLASSDSSYVNGIELTVDGGSSAI